MKVRDKRYKKSDYLGRETYAMDKLCPCRPCFSVHDCGRFSGGEWRSYFACVTRFNNGCPHPIPEPVHILHSTREYVCKRCGKRLSPEERSASKIVDKV